MTLTPGKWSERPATGRRSPSFALSSPTTSFTVLPLDSVFFLPDMNWNSVPSDLQPVVLLCRSYADPQRYSLQPAKEDRRKSGFTTLVTEREAAQVRQVLEAIEPFVNNSELRDLVWSGQVALMEQEAREKGATLEAAEVSSLGTDRSSPLISCLPFSENFVDLLLQALMAQRAADPNQPQNGGHAQRNARPRVQFRASFSFLFRFPRVFGSTATDPSITFGL